VGGGIGTGRSDGAPDSRQTLLAALPEYDYRIRRNCSKDRLRHALPAAQYATLDSAIDWGIDWTFD
jgi:hypothetical protein